MIDKEVKSVAAHKLRIITKAKRELRLYVVLLSFIKTAGGFLSILDTDMAIATDAKTKSIMNAMRIAGIESLRGTVWENVGARVGGNIIPKFRIVF